MAHRPGTLVVAALLLAASGCGGGAAATEGGPPDDGDRSGAGGAHTAGDGDTDPPPTDPRVLPAGATFGDLLSSVQRLDDRAEADSTAGCILRGRGGASPWRLEADLSVAVRPLPEAPADLDERVGEATAVRVLSRWGQRGTSVRDFVLVAFTSTPPLSGEGGIGVFLTDQGVYSRPVGEEEVELVGPVSVDQIGARLQQRLADQAVPVYVAAEAGVSLETLRTLLHWLPESVAGSTVLSVPLAPDTRLPEPGAIEGQQDAGLCPDGPPSPEDESAEGELDAATVVEALAPFRDAARECFSNATGTAARGGRVTLAILVDREGAVSEACAPEDETGSPGFRACLLEALDAIRFPPPDPPGRVEVRFPLVFEPDDSLRQQPLCD